MSIGAISSQHVRHSIVLELIHSVASIVAGVRDLEVGPAWSSHQTRIEVSVIELASRHRVRGESCGPNAAGSRLANNARRFRLVSLLLDRLGIVVLEFLSQGRSNVVCSGSLVRVFFVEWIRNFTVGELDIDEVSAFRVIVFKCFQIIKGCLELMLVLLLLLSSRSLLKCKLFQVRAMRLLFRMHRGEFNWRETYILLFFTISKFNLG